MQRKLNEEYIREYSEQFSEKITSDIFENQDAISGKEILNCTPSRQVNLFIIKSLFLKWQDEMKQLESPFFNYKAPEVRKAMVQFMNVLSQHIQVDGDHFIELAEKAVQQSLALAADPELYFRDEFSELENTKLSEKVTKPLMKYIKLHHETISELFDEHNDAPVEEFFEELGEVLNELDTESVLEDLIELLSQVSPITTDRIFLKDEEPDKKEEASEEDELPILLHEIEEEVAAEEKESEEVNDVAVEEPEKDEFPDETPIENTGSPKEVLQANPESQIEPEEEKIDSGEEPDVEEDKAHEEEAPIGQDIESSEELAEEEVEADEEEEKSGTASINEQFASEPETVNKQFSRSSEATVAEKLETTKISSIMEAISVNHQYMFTKELFDGDRSSFNQAIEEIDDCDSFDDAVEMIVQNHAKARSWDMNSDEVKELLKVVFRKFRD